MNLTARIVAAPVRAYRRWISPLSAPRCKFYPTCSTYALEVLETHGVLKGTLLTIGRLARCNPWARDGVDLPPKPGKWRGEHVRRLSDDELAQHWARLDAAEAEAKKGQTHGVH